MFFQFIRGRLIYFKKKDIKKKVRGIICPNGECAAIAQKMVESILGGECELKNKPDTVMG